MPSSADNKAYYQTNKAAVLENRRRKHNGLAEAEKQALREKDRLRKAEQAAEQSDKRAAARSKAVANAAIAKRKRMTEAEERDFLDANSVGVYKRFAFAAAAKARRYKREKKVSAKVRMEAMRDSLPEGRFERACYAALATDGFFKLCDSTVSDDFLTKAEEVASNGQNAIPVFSKVLKGKRLSYDRK
jgi:hypothetical protein